MNECILVVDDDPEIVRAIAILLEKEGYQVLKAYNGMEALEQAVNPALRLIIIDVMMPRLDGLSAVMKIREKRNLPIIVLSAKSEDSDKVLGLSMGADDYIVKPLEMPEVIARVRAVFRRIAPDDAPEKLTFDNLVIDKQAYDLVIKGKRVDAPPKEIELLYFLASNPNRVFTRAQLLDEVWGFDYFGDTRTVDVHVKRLREKLEGVSDKWEVKTVWGVGYKFETKE